MEQDDKEQYLKQGALAVLGVLRDLLKNQTPMRVSHPRGQFITRLLYVDKTSMVIDFGSNDYDNQLAKEANELHIVADTRGARIELILPSLEMGEYEGLPAFTSALPDQLKMIQRREYFRVNAPLNPLYYCYVPWPDGSGERRLRLQDLSIGGVGVLSDSTFADSLNCGDNIKKLRLEMGEYGRFVVDAQVISIGKHSVVGNKCETIVTPRLSLRFLSLNAAQERELQQVIFSLERLARDKANRFQ
ncbi:flagellar brake protein [Erwinia piriflorinigrans]|uniref:Flagellar brake protein YcgR n=1 Tax=Erwinia piriflorinigrans CFBP 5888 TaxID=1161919 RepID=V5Z7N8_9GAMM|nr:inner membrane protein YcgR [Erwinia piriflorinigrans CFBP 5888]